jgi:hypothetical protein
MRILKALGPPFLALLLAQAVLAAAARTSGVAPFASGSYVRWDSYRYLQIAKGGYYLDLDGPSADANTGWFPGYPLLVRVLQKASRLKPALVGRLVALGFHYATLCLLWVICRRGAPSAAHRVIGLLLGAFFPAFVYYSAVFPISVVTAFTLLALLAAADGRFLLAGAAGAIAAFCYPTGVLVAAPLLLAVLLASGLDARGRLRAVLEGPVLCSLGLAAVLTCHRLAVGHWDAFLQQQRRFDHGVFNPLATLAVHLIPLISPDTQAAAYIPGLQTLLVAVLVIAVAVACWRRRAMLTRGDALFLAHVIVFWLFPLVVGRGVSIYRAESLLLPIVPLLVRARAAVLAALLAVFVALGGAMAALFFQTVLI